MGAAYIASALRNAGHDIVIYNQDQYHYPESHLTDYLTNNRFDVVGLGIIAGGIIRGGLDDGIDLGIILLFMLEEELQLPLY